MSVPGSPEGNESLSDSTAAAEVASQYAGAHDEESLANTTPPPRLLAWASEHSLAMPGWLIPVVVIAVTGLLGHAAHPTLVCFWLGVVGAVVVYTLVALSFDPAPYSRLLGGTAAVVVGLVLTQLLLHHLGHSLLSP